MADIDPDEIIAAILTSGTYVNRGNVMPLVVVGDFFEMRAELKRRRAGEEALQQQYQGPGRQPESDHDPFSHENLQR